MVQTRRVSCFAGAILSLALAGCAAGLAGCGKKPEPPPEPAVQPVTPPSPRPAVTLPPRTPGLWEMTVTEEGSAEPPQVLEICIDAETDRNLGILGTDLSGDRCQKTVSGNGTEGWGILAACDMGNGVVNEYSGSITGDYTQQYDMKLRSQTANPDMPQMNRVAKYTVAARRKGDCPAGQSPGDVANDGVQFNLFDMAGMSRSGAADSEAPLH